MYENYETTSESNKETMDLNDELLSDGGLVNTGDINSIIYLPNSQIQ